MLYGRDSALYARQAGAQAVVDREWQAGGRVTGLLITQSTKLGYLGRFSPICKDDVCPLASFAPFPACNGHLSAAQEKGYTQLMDGAPATPLSPQLPYLFARSTFFFNISLSSFIFELIRGYIQPGPLPLLGC